MEISPSSTFYSESSMISAGNTCNLQVISSMDSGSSGSLKLKNEVDIIKDLDMPRLSKDLLRCRWCWPQDAGATCDLADLGCSVHEKLSKAMGLRNTFCDFCDVTEFDHCISLQLFLHSCWWHYLRSLCVGIWALFLDVACFWHRGYFNDCTAKFTVCSDSKLEALASIAFFSDFYIEDRWFGEWLGGSHFWHGGCFIWRLWDFK